MPRSFILCTWCILRSNKLVNSFKYVFDQMAKKIVLEKVEPLVHKSQRLWLYPFTIYNISWVCTPDPSSGCNMWYRSSCQFIGLSFSGKWMVRYCTYWPRKVCILLNFKSNILKYKTRCVLRPCGGTSHFGSGTLGLFKPIAERNIIMYSIKLYRQLEAKGYDIGMLLINKSLVHIIL